MICNWISSSELEFCCRDEPEDVPPDEAIGSSWGENYSDVAGPSYLVNTLTQGKKK